MSQHLQILLGLLTLISVVGGFIYWHFKTVNSFKDQVNDLKMQMKELENRDNLQQQTIDQLKELYPVLKTVIENLNKGKK
jgi:response regulator of citrate/malate metabolism